jgi:putative DNA primase/helicase
VIAALLAENEERCEPPLNEEEVRSIIASAEKKRTQTASTRESPDLSIHPVDAAQQPENAVVPLLDAHWQNREILNKHSAICRLLRAEAKGVLGGELTWDEMLLAPTVRRPGEPPKEFSPGDRSRIHERMEVLFPPQDPNGGGRYARALIDLALEQVAQEASYHPVREYLGELCWDGVSRIAGIKSDVLQSEDPPISDVVLRRWMVSAIARVMQPGCKVDTVLILVGPQGAGKSSFFEVLASELWFSDSTIDIHNKDAYMALARAWIVEFPELESMQRARDVDSVKAFLSSRVDSYRPPYGRAVMKVPRTCVIVGTTNQDTFLTDPTGNRRYWPVTVGPKIALERLRTERDQLWAEARVAFEVGERWWLSEQEEQELSALRGLFDICDPWDSEVDHYLGLKEKGADQRPGGGAPTPFSSADVLDSIGKHKEQRTRADEMRVATILKRKGYVSIREMDGRKKRRVWKHPTWSIELVVEHLEPGGPTRPTGPTSPIDVEPGG